VVHRLPVIIRNGYGLALAIFINFITSAIGTRLSALFDHINLSDFGRFRTRDACPVSIFATHGFTLHSAFRLTFQPFPPP
jgi:hypothetical protein